MIKQKFITAKQMNVKPHFDFLEPINTIFRHIDEESIATFTDNQQKTI